MTVKPNTAVVSSQYRSLLSLLLADNAVPEPSRASWSLRLAPSGDGGSSLDALERPGPFA